MIVAIQPIISVHSDNSLNKPIQHRFMCTKCRNMKDLTMHQFICAQFCDGPICEKCGGWMTFKVDIIVK